MGIPREEEKDGIWNRMKPRVPTQSVVERET